MSFDDDWGEEEEPPKEVTKADMDRMAREMGMKLTVDAPQSNVSTSNKTDSPQKACSLKAENKKTAKPSTLNPRPR